MSTYLYTHVYMHMDERGCAHFYTHIHADVYTHVYAKNQGVLSNINEDALAEKSGP